MSTAHDTNLNAREVAEQHLAYAPLTCACSKVFSAECNTYARLRRLGSLFPDERIHDPEVKELLDIALPNLG